MVKRLVFTLILYICTMKHLSLPLNFCQSPTPFNGIMPGARFIRQTEICEPPPPKLEPNEPTQTHNKSDSGTKGAKACINKRHNTLIVLVQLNTHHYNSLNTPLMRGQTAKSRAERRTNKQTKQDDGSILKCILNPPRVRTLRNQHQANNKKPDMSLCPHPRFN